MRIIRSKTVFTPNLPPKQKNVVTILQISRFFSTLPQFMHKT